MCAKKKREQIFTCFHLDCAFIVIELVVLTLAGPVTEPFVNDFRRLNVPLLMSQQPIVWVDDVLAMPFR